MPSLGIVIARIRENCDELALKTAKSNIAFVIPSLKAGCFPVANARNLHQFAHLNRPDGQFGSPENVAAVIALLASNDGAHMTGEVEKRRRCSQLPAGT